MASPEASEMIANIGTLTFDEIIEFLPVAKRKTQEYIGILAKSTASARREEENARSTIALYESFSAERQRQHQHLLDSLWELLDELIACRTKGEKDMHGFIKESISMEKACMKRVKDLMKKGEIGKNI
ncbi:uncharacterized protein Bfra_010570 [Botrytis fragariae]|uniref:Uncharacterized protein n=1 Tax=Botrytis fragariae TaxID=1964551 RepID=A0A8H6AHS7_9HELO|nr:uncharacterized protein Bfra_010570 [Botrytis fragariae]KAF5867595.1 hypothetical protein Bfra_010570 [Botrytis fragariae]